MCKIECEVSLRSRYVVKDTEAFACAVTYGIERSSISWRKKLSAYEISSSWLIHLLTSFRISRAGGSDNYVNLLHHSTGSASRDRGSVRITSNISRVSKKDRKPDKRMGHGSPLQ